MRISSLARKIKVKPSELISFCEQNEIELDNGAHSKLNPDQVERIYAEFAPEFLIMEAPQPEEQIVEYSEPKEESEVAPTETETTIEDLINVKEEATPESIVEETTTPEAKSPKEKVSEEDVTEEEVEVIRAPKITLPGLKVKGKIDLPEPKKPEPKEEKKLEEEKAQSKKKSGRKKRGRNGEDYNPVAAARKRKQEREEKERVAAQKKKKKAKAQHYYKMQKKVAKTKQVKVEEQNVSHARPASEVRETKKNVLQRFWRWFNT